MGLRPTLSIIGVTNAAKMAPALTEPVSQAKLSSPNEAASPRPQILHVTTANINNNGQYICETKSSTGHRNINNGINKIAFEEEIPFSSNEPLSNGPKNGSLAALLMDHSDHSLYSQQPSQRQNKIIDLPQQLSSSSPSSTNTCVIQSSPSLTFAASPTISANNCVQSPQQNITPSSLSQQSGVGNTTPTNSISSGSTINMGLQRDYLKDNADMEQMLGELASSGDIGDLMQVFKSFDSVPASDNLCELAGGLALFNDVDVMNIASLEYVSASTPNKETLDTLEIRNEIEKRQAQMIRKCDFLIRRLKKIQARCMGQHINEEINILFDYIQQLVKQKERESKTITTMTPLSQLTTEKQKQHQTCSLKNLIKRIDYAANCQQSSIAINSNNLSASSSSKNNADAVSSLSKSTLNAHKDLSSSSTSKKSRSNSVVVESVLPNIDLDGVRQIERSAGMLKSQVKCVASAIDSDATASSSGGESADEMILYNNLTQTPQPITKRAAWRWGRDRAGIASRWNWLFSQISDLEYRSRQHNELHQQIKKSKGAVSFEDGHIVPDNVPASTAIPAQSSVNGYRGILPGNTKASCTITGTDGNSDILSNDALDGSAATSSADATFVSCRTRAFQRAGFKKRKLTQTINLHTASKKAARQSTVKCGCQWPLQPCALCTGRHDPTAPRDIPDMHSMKERFSLLDSAYHPVVSFNDDVSQSIYFEATMRKPEWQTKVSKSSAKSILKGALALQKQIEREDRTSVGTTAIASSIGGLTNDKKYDSINLSPTAPRKYKKKYNTTSSKQKTKKNKYAHLINKKYKKKSKANLMDSDNEHQNSVSNSHRQQSSLNYHQGSIEMMEIDSISSPGTPANGALPRSKTTSPTPGSNSKYDRHSYEKRNKNSYDIDNIVIPYSVAAATRVEVLQYKEIPTPKWRVLEEAESVPKAIDTTKIDDQPGEELLQDTKVDDSQTELLARHERALTEERKKFATYLKFPWSTHSRANRRIDSKADSSGANTPDRASTPPKTPSVIGDHESIPSPAAPLTTQALLENIENSGSISTNTIEGNVTGSLSGCSTPLTGGGPSNGNLIAPNSIKFERRRTVSLRKTEDGSRFSGSTTEIREIVKPFNILSFPLTDELCESMLKVMPDYHRTTSIVGDDTMNHSVGVVVGGGGGDGGSNYNNMNNIQPVIDQRMMNNSNSSYIVTNENGDEDNNLSNLNTTRIYSRDFHSDEETESVESGVIDEDPNDPEWCEPQN